MKNSKTFIVGALTCVVLCASTALGANVRVTIQNLSPDDGVALTPFFVAAHDGTFDTFDANSAAGAGIENVAELGDTTQIVADINSAQPAAVATTAVANVGGFGPGIYVPGASGFIDLTLDPSGHRFFSFASMVIPSSDSFLGNDAPDAYELFNEMGDFVAGDIFLLGEDIWDAGTETNQVLGAAYIVGQDAMLGAPEGGVVQLATLPGQLSTYIGQSVPAGGTFDVLPETASPIASISFTLIPEPATGLLLSGCVLGLLACSWRRPRRTDPSLSGER